MKKRLLIKNGFRKQFKNYVQFIVYIFLVILGIVFTVSFGVTAINIQKVNNRVTKNLDQIDYSFRYTSSGYNANDTQTLNPWFTFNGEVLNINNLNYSTLSIGSDDDVLKPYNFLIDSIGENKFSYDSSIYKIEDKMERDLFVNFGFGDVESHSYSNSNSYKNWSYTPSKSEQVLNFNNNQKFEVVKSRRIW